MKTSQEIVNETRDYYRARFEGFDIQSNGKGLRVECDQCHESDSSDSYLGFLLLHKCQRVGGLVPAL